MNNTFDQQIDQAVAGYHYSVSPVSDARYHELKASVLKNRPLIKPGLTDMDAYSLVGYINKTHPSLEDVLGKYAELNPIWTFTFFEALLSTNKEFFQSHKATLHKLISEATPGQYDGTSKDILLLYSQTNKPLITDFEAFLNTKEKLVFRDQSILSKIVIAEKEELIGYELLEYLDKRKEEPNAGNYISFWELYTTKNKELNAKYKKFMESKLLSEGFNGRTWGGYSSFLVNWFSRDELVTLCELKKKEASFNLTEYITRAAYYQVAYFPIDNSLKLIETAPGIYHKLFLAFILANTRTDLTDVQKKWLSNYFGKLGKNITGSTESTLAVLLERSIDPSISYSAVTKKYPRLYKAWHPPTYLEDNFNAARYSWTDVIRICNDLNTFNKPVREPDEYSKAEYMTGNYAFRLNNLTVLDRIFRQNNVLTDLVPEYGDWPIDYEYIVDKPLTEVFASHHISYSVFHDLKYLDGNNVEYRIFLRLGNRLHTIQFNDSTSYPNNEALYLLFNKALQDAGLPQRFVKYNKESYDLLFVEPDRYEEMMKRLRQ